MCSVCRTAFSLPPPPEPSRDRVRKLVTWLVTWAYAAVALVVIMLPARVYTSASGLLLFGAVPAAIFVAMWRHGLALAMVGGGRLALIRTGAPVPQLRAGLLLVSEGIPDSSLLGRSVVLLTEHSEFGTRGLVLNKPASRYIARRYRIY